MFAYTLNPDSWLLADSRPAPVPAPVAPRKRKTPETRESLEDAFRAKYPNWVFILDLFRDATGRRATWQHMTKSNLSKFVDHLRANFAPNTANQYAVRLKAVLNIYSDEIKLPADFARILSPKKVASTAVYLDESELARLEQYTPANDNERFVRNMFLISSYSGARHVDAVNLNASNIQGDNLVFIAQKTRKEARLPLKPIVAEYIADTPRVELSDVSFNAIIRRICRAVGIVERVKICKAGKEIELDKCDAVTSHTARRSYATNLYLRGVDLYTISRLCQHSSVELTKKYICADIRKLDDNAMRYFS